MDEINADWMKPLNWKRFIPAITWFFIVLFLLCMPGDDIPHVDDWFHRLNFDKWIHVGVFGLMALLFMRPVGNSYLNRKNKWVFFIIIACALSIWGLSTEFIQKYYVHGRSFDLLDWGADSLGCFIALLIEKYRINHQGSAQKPI